MVPPELEVWFPTQRPAADRAFALNQQAARSPDFASSKSVPIPAGSKNPEQDQEDREHNAHDPFGPTLFFAPIDDDRRDII